jgi:glycosyltransferase involved in cell wall biosynthesis
MATKTALPILTPEEITPPVIQPVPAGIKRPRWSVMIPTFNCARFLRETIESVLSEDIDPAEMQIEVIDDCSTVDDPEAVVREFGQGRVSFYRKPVNAGAIANFNTCIERSIGKLVHILHGDDAIKPGFYRTIEERSEAYDESIALFISRCLVVDESGALDSLSPRIIELEKPSDDPSCLFLGNSVRTPGCVIRRSFYEEQGGFLPPLVHTADWEMWARATAIGRSLFINEPLAVYRTFDGNDSGRLARSAENMRDFYRLSQVMSRLYSTYPTLRFIQVIGEISAYQAERFRQDGDQKAAEANLEVYRQLTPELVSERKSVFVRATNKLLSMIRHLTRLGAI